MFLGTFEYALLPRQPFAEERARYLAHLLERGRARETVIATTEQVSGLGQAGIRCGVSSRRTQKRVQRERKIGAYSASASLHLTFLVCFSTILSDLSRELLNSK